MNEGGPGAPRFDAEEVGVQLARAGEVADRREVGLWLGGGALRDLLLGRPLATWIWPWRRRPANALELAARIGALAGWTLEKTAARLGPRRSGHREGLRVDLAATRRGNSASPGVSP